MAENQLHLVAAAAGARTYAERSYRETIAEAAKHHSQAEIARAAGVTRQSIHAMLKQLAEKTDRGVRARTA
jgi:DNA-binding MarR family transcriptional regulator